MFDAVIHSIAFKGYLHQSVNSGSDTEVQIEGDGELATEVSLEWHTVHVAKGFHKGVDCDVGAAEMCRAVELKCSDGDCR